MVQLPAHPSLLDTRCYFNVVLMLLHRLRRSPTSVYKLTMVQFIEFSAMVHVTYQLSAHSSTPVLAKC